MQNEHDIIIIGAGVVGISTALELQARGRRVLVLDRDGVAAQASRGNAGAFAFSAIEPLATPGIMRKAPKWLLDPLGPLSIRPSYALTIAPWLLRFWRASWRDRFEAACDANAHLMRASSAALERQIATVDGADLMQRDGQLQLFESAREFAASAHMFSLMRRNGIAFDELSNPDAIAEIQPGLSRQFTHAAFAPGWMNTVDPLKWVERLAAHVFANGGAFQRANVTALAQGADGVTVQTDTGALRARQVVVASGAWSHQLARSLGDRIPLETERGYNTTLPPGAFDLRTHLSFSGHAFAVSRINGGVRVGGATELGGLKLPPNYKRSDMLLAKAARFMPGLKTDGGTQWMGFRPSMPDSLPVIGASPRAPDVFYGFGHGHLGLTQSSGTAALIGQLTSGETPSIPMAPYRADRF